MSGIWKLLIVLLLAGSASAQMPHEVLVLVNRESQASKLAANTFVAMRGIPKPNMVYLDIPESAYGGKATITPEQFTKLIWEPANQAAKEQGVDQQILAWVYSVDFPIRVSTDSNDRKQMSVGGMTFMRNKVPGLGLVEDGKYLSKLFSGPNERIKLNLNAMSLGMQKRGLGSAADVPPEAAYLQRGLGDRIPLPSMMLGYIGENGTDLETVLSCINLGIRSDHRGVRTGIHFLMTEDVRSKCREWQFYPAINELQQRGITATVTTNFPAGEKNIMGILMGAEEVDPSAIGSFAPGAMAEHLTSWSAEFQKPQTKMTEWLKAGATASAGVVVEPYSNPNKFTSARFFVHYSSGCTMLESFYQSIACPLQSLLLGDPLAKPYAMPVGVNILGADTVESDFTYLAQAKSQAADATYNFTFLLDGKLVQERSDSNSYYLRSLKVADGYHELRVVASVKHLVEFNALRDKPIVVNRMGRSITIQPSISRLAKHEHGIKVRIGGAEMPEKIRLISGAVILDEKIYGENAELVMDELVMGEGPNKIQAVGIYADGMRVASAPLSFGIKFNTAE